MDNVQNCVNYSNIPSSQPIDLVLDFLMKHNFCCWNYMVTYKISC
jgi:hypothetical protein